MTNNAKKNVLDLLLVDLMAMRSEMSDERRYKQLNSAIVVIMAMSSILKRWKEMVLGLNESQNRGIPPTDDDKSKLHKLYQDTIAVLDPTESGVLPTSDYSGSSNN